MILPFIKMQGVGNDFVVVDARGWLETDWSAVAVRLCRRHYGIGADGLLVIGDAPEADARMEMFNPDGTRDFCGNGLRCVARYVADRAGRGESAVLRLATLAGVRHAEVRRIERRTVVTVDMGEPAFAPEAVPVITDGSDALDMSLALASASIRIAALSTGSTHAVTFVDALPDDRTFETISAEVETHPAFPERTSLMWVRRDAPDRLTMRIWERGAGETLGCGTGACAAAVAARLRGLTRSPVTVATGGGELTVEWEPGSRIRMTGPAEYVFHGSVRL
jgi:diaminopimelate epimerase